MQTQALSGSVIRLDPLVIMASRNDNAHLGMATVAPELFTDRPSLHFIKPTHSLKIYFDSLQKHLEEACKRLPRAKFVIMANEEWELVELQARGITAFVANNFILADENTFDVQENVTRQHDALYNAMFRKLKNHHLCAEIASLALIYYRQETYSEPECERSVRKLLVQATYLNETKYSTYRELTADEVASAINSSHVGLCMSAAEGAMRACAEFLLCGVPVVTVPAIGGRARYLHLGNSRTVESTQSAVAAAVAELKALDMNPYDIREEFLNIIDFERRNFLAYINASIKRQFGVSNCVKNFSALRGASRYQTIEQWKQWLGAA